MKSRFVYHDKRYDTNWINSATSKQLTDALVKEDYRLANADDLSKIMGGTASKPAHETIVIFSQDIVPDTVFPDISPNIPFRRFLQHGGTVVWLGDIPFWYRGHNRGLSKDSCEKVSHTAAFYHALGVAPVHAFPRNEVMPTRAGRRIFTERWFSMRPIDVWKTWRGMRFNFDPPGRLDVLAWSRVAFGWRTIGRKLGWSARRGIGFETRIPFINVSFEATAEAASRSRFIVEETELASAWRLNLSERHPHSGFVRIWDFNLPEITPRMMVDLRSLVSWVGSSSKPG